MMTDTMQAFVAQETLFSKNDTILLAVSGGVDSVVMLHLFSQLHPHFAVAHGNFNLRGQESDADQALVESLAQQYGVAFHHQSFETTTYATRQQVSIQMAARTLRYQWFDQLLQDHNYAYVATAHHREDQLETALLNFTKGTGVAGLRGMLAKHQNVIRPMLWATKAAIKTYAEEHALIWREDQSNASDDYQRNLLRHQVIPSLLSINPNLWDTFAHTAERLRATEQLLKQEVSRFVREAVRHRQAQTSIDLRALQSHRQPALLLSELLKPYGFSYVQSRAVAAQMNPPTVGKIFSSGKWDLLIDRQQLILYQPDSTVSSSVAVQVSDKEVAWDDHRLIIRRHRQPDYTIRPDARVAALDADQLVFPLIIRRWQPGDRFCPLGMERHKKVSDFLIDQKVSRLEKESVYVLLSENTIVWVMGYRLDHRYRVTKNTRRIYEIVLPNA